MMADKLRQLVKGVPGVSILTGLPTSAEGYVTGSNWRKLDPVTLGLSQGVPAWSGGVGGVYAWSSYIDLSGMDSRNQALVPMNFMVQEGGPPSPIVINTQLGEFLYDCRIWEGMSSVPISDVDLCRAVGGYGADYFLNTEDFEHLIGGRFTVWGSSSASMLPLVINREFAGSGDVTNTDRIYCYAVICNVGLLVPVDPTPPGPPNPVEPGITYPPRRLILGAMETEIPDLTSLEIMRRSYELQQGQDVD